MPSQLITGGKSDPRRTLKQDVHSISLLIILKPRNSRLKYTSGYKLNLCKVFIVCPASVELSWVIEYMPSWNVGASTNVL
jgi:hypothetical protein